MKRGETLAKYALNLTYSQIPSDVREHAKKMLLDQFGVTLAGTSTKAGRAAREFNRKYFKEGPCCVFGSRERYAAAGAAWANAITGSALDMDEGHNVALGHPAAVVFPVILAVCEEKNLSGEDFLKGFIIGYEAACRISVSRVGGKSFATGTWAGIGAALGAGTLLGLTGEELIHAMGIAGCHMPARPPSRGYDFVPMIKETIGWSALAGLSAALLAGEGMTGFHDLLERDTYSEKMVDGLGQEYLMLKNYFKPYAACRWTHAAIDGAFFLTHEKQIQSRDIESIEVSTFERASLLDNPSPKTTEEAQYSLPWTVACVIAEGRVGPDQISENRLAEPMLRELAAKVTLKRDPVSDSLFPEVRRAVVSIRMKEGTVHRKEIVGPRGDFLNPMDKEDLEEKLFSIASPLLTDAGVRGLAKMLSAIEKIGSISEITRFIESQGSFS